MKTHAIVIAIVSLVTGACSLAQPLPPDPEPTALTLIVDTSWSCDRYEGDFRTLGRQAISALGPGDCLTIIATKASRCTIALAHTVKKGDAAEAKAIYDVLAGIEAGFLSDADVAIALETTVTRLTELYTRRRIGRVITIVLSDGQMNSPQVRRVLTVADRYKDRGWSLYMTGTRDTSRDILLAANKGRLAWTLLTQANPSLWLERTEAAPAPCPEDDDRRTQQPSDPSSGRPPQETPTQGSSTGQRRPQRSQGTEFSLTGRINGLGPFVPLPELPDNEAAAPPPGPVLDPNQSSRSPDEPPAETKKDRPLLGQSLWERLSHRPGKILFWTALLLLMCLAVVAVVLLTGGLKEARQWSTRMNARLRPRKVENDGILTLRLNDQPHRLGRLDQIKEIHVGSGEQNTIRIPDKSIADRLLSLCRKANGLMLRNLSGAPLNVNGRIVKPRRSAAVVLGSPIKLNERFTLTPELVTPQSRSNTANNRSHQDGPAQQ